MCLLVCHNFFEVADSTLIPFKDVADVIPIECKILGKIFDVMHFNYFVMSFTAKYVQNASVTLLGVHIWVFLPRGTQSYFACYNSVRKLKQIIVQ